MAQFLAIGAVESQQNRKGHNSVEHPIMSAERDLQNVPVVRDTEYIKDLMKRYVNVRGGHSKLGARKQARILEKAKQLFDNGILIKEDYE